MKFHQSLVGPALVLAAALCHAQASSAPAPALAGPADAEVVQAAAHGNAGELRQLLQRGGNPRAAGPQGAPAISYALLSKNPETLGVLLQADPTLAKETLGNGHGKTHSILLYAAMMKQPAMVAALLHSGADAQEADPDGVTILENAAVGADAQSVQLLIEAGASPIRRDILGRTPLMLAAGAGNQKIAHALLDHGVDVSAADSNGFTALHWVATDPRIAESSWTR